MDAVVANPTSAAAAAAQPSTPLQSLPECLREIAVLAERIPTEQNLSALDGAIDRYKLIRATPIPTPSAAAAAAAATSSSSTPATADKTAVLEALATHETAVKALYTEMHDARKAAGAAIRDLSAWGAALDGFITKINAVVDKVLTSYKPLSDQPQDNDIEASWKRLQAAMGSKADGSLPDTLLERTLLFEVGFAHHIYERGGKITTVTDFQRNPANVWWITKMMGWDRTQPIAEHQKRSFGPIKLLNGTEFTLGGKA